MKTMTGRFEVDEANGQEQGTWLEVIRRQVGSLSFGVVQIVVHEGRVVQIDRTEKVRFVHPIAAAGGQD
jgi:hypothetical protein